MSGSTKFRIAMTTCASMAEARRISRTSVAKKLAACVNIVRKVESIYRWNGKLQRSEEILVIIKTSTARLKGLERHIKREHSYSVPEFVVLPILGGSGDYLRWLAQNT